MRKLCLLQQLYLSSWISICCIIDFTGPTSEMCALFAAQSRQSAKLFLQSQASVPPPPPPPGSGGRDTLAGERGGGRVPIPTRGHSLWYSLLYVLCGLQVAEYAAKLEQYDRAIQIYEQVGHLLNTFDALK